MTIIIVKQLKISTAKYQTFKPFQTIFLDEAFKHEYLNKHIKRKRTESLTGQSYTLPVRHLF
jgi:hypothetical protein